MRKTFLLLFAAIGLTTTAMAQSAVIADMERETASVKAPFELVETEQNAIEATAGPMRSLANGIWYNRPAGTFLDTRKSIQYMVVPPFTELTWTNMSTNPLETLWKWGEEAVNDYEESQIVDNNFVNSFSMGTFYGPYVLKENVDTFSVVASQVTKKYPVVVAPKATTFMTHVPTTTAYTGFDGSPGFRYGNNPPMSADRDGKTETYYYSRYFEYFNAPAQPLYLESISFYAALSEGKTAPMEAGTEGVICYVVLAGENAKIGDPTTYTDTISVIPINPIEAEIGEYQEGYTTVYVTAYCMEEDELGGLMQKPVVIDRDFVLIFDGFNNKGVDFGITMSKIPEEEFYFNGGPYPTVWHALWASDNTKKSGHWYYSSSGNSPYQYNMIVYLNGMFDVAALYEGVTDFYAPEEGGQVYSLGEKDGEEVKYTGVDFHTVFPYQSEESPMPSYSVEGLPDWLSISGFNNDYYDSKYGWVTILYLEAEPLPAGVDGREAKLRFISEKGAKSEEFSVKQGDVPDGIENIVDEQKVENNATYNLSGQKVDSNYRGIVIKNGKKNLNR